MSTPLLCSVSQTPSREKSASALFLELNPRAWKGSGPSTANLSSPSWLRSDALIARSMPFRTCAGNARPTAQSGEARCRTVRAKLTLRLLGEVDLRRLRHRLLVLDRELRLLLEAEHHRGEVARERAHGDVVLLHRLDEALARDGNAVLGAFELRLQFKEVLVGLQLRIVLRDHQKTR